MNFVGGVVEGEIGNGERVGAEFLRKGREGEINVLAGGVFSRAERAGHCHVDGEEICAREPSDCCRGFGLREVALED